MKDYDYELHYVAWPSSAGAAPQNLYAELKVFSTFMQTVTTVTPASTTTWLAQFHAVALTTQNDNDALRNALGLEDSHNFP